MVSTSDGDPFHTEPLRVGVFLDAITAPAWVAKIVAEIVQSPCTELKLCVVNDAPRKSTLQRVLNPRKFLYNVYTKLDERLFSVKDDAFRKVDLSPLLSECDLIRVKAIRKKFLDYFSQEDTAAIRSHNLDVVLRFGFRILQGEALKVARYGVWSYHHADNCVNRGLQPGFWEVMEDTPVTGSVLQILSSELDGGRVIYRSYGRTCPYSVSRNRNPVYWKTANFVSRKLTELHRDGPSALSDPLGNGYRPYSHRLYKTATNTQMLRLLPKIAMRVFGRGIRALSSVESWSIAYVAGENEQHPATTFYKSRQLTPPKTCFWADPFPVEKDGRYYIFLEEYPYKAKRGHISVIELDEQGRYDKHYPVLKLDYHLSYPCVFQWKGSYFMVPESAENRTVDLYRCNSFPREWVHEKTLMDDVNAVDATLCEHDGRWWMFVTMGDNGSLEDELFLFHADTPLGPWRPHRKNPVKSDVRSSRPAGKIFKCGEHLYRPAQDGSGEYGSAISINRIDHLSLDCYCETEVSRIVPKWRGGLRGTHTLNHVKGLTVIDQKHRALRKPF